MGRRSNKDTGKRMETNSVTLEVGLWKTFKDVCAAGCFNHNAVISMACKNFIAAQQAGLGAAFTSAS